MRIIIVGNGKVGYALARQLSSEGHDLSLVDKNPDNLARADGTLDVLCIEGNGASIRVLDSAGVRQSDLVIAVTEEDEINLVCCLIAKKLGAKHTIARVRNPEYRADADMLKAEIGLDMVINPDLGAAQEIARILSFPAAFSVEPFARGRIDMIGLQVAAEDALCGVPLSDFSPLRKAQALVCAAQRDGEYIIPNGAYTPQAGDSIYLIGAKSDLRAMLKTIGRSVSPIRDVSIIGGSRLSIYLGWELQRSGIDVRIVELDHEKCLRLSRQLPKALIIEGDGADSALLQQENILGTDALVAVTGRDEDNLLMALYARRNGMEKVVAKMNRPNYSELVKDIGLDSIVSPKNIISDSITRYVRALANSEGSPVESLYKMMDGSVEALEFTVGENARILHQPLKTLHLKKGVLVAAIGRRSDIIIPDGNTTVEPGDRVVLVTHGMMVDTLDDILA